MEYFIQQVDGVKQPFEEIPAQYRLTRHFQAPLTQRQQAGRQVTAIHRGNIAGMQGFQTSCVVPVYEVPPVAFQLIECIK